MSLPRFSVEQSVLVNVLFFVCFLGGLISFSRIPIEFYPDIVLNTVNINTVWSGASADEVERLVTQKLEEELVSISDVKEMRSTSQANFSSVVIDFDEDLDELNYQAAVNDVRAALDRVSDLPESAEEPELFEVTISEVVPAVMIAIVDTKGVGAIPLGEIAAQVATRVGDLGGVNRTSVLGEREREVRVLVERAAASRYGLTVLDVVDRIRRQNLNVPAGTFDDGGGEATLRARGDYQRIEDILETVVRETAEGSYVRLADIARIERTLEKERLITRYNGKPALLVNVTKKTGADVIDMVSGIDAWMESYRPLLPDGVELHKTLDTAGFVIPRMRTLADNLLSGIVLVLAILWVTIGFRNAILTVIAIPFSFLTAMMLFPTLGISINATTLMGMLLVSGMLVDDAIIVLENIYSRIERGETLRTAVIEGTEEVMWPVAAAVMTTCAAFAPLLLIGGTPGKFVEILPKAVLVCLIASLFECLLILPAHYIDFGSRSASRSPSPDASGLRRYLATSAEFFGRILPAARDGYAILLDLVLAHRFAFGTLLFSILMLAYGSWGHLRVELFPGEFDNFNVLLESPANYSLDQTDAVVRDIEERLQPFLGRDVSDFASTIGASVASNYDRITSNNVSRTFLIMAPTDENRVAPEDLLFRVRDSLDALRKESGNGIVDLRVAAEQDGPPIGPPVEVRIQGDDYELSKSIAEQMAAYLETIPGVFNIEHSLKPGPDEVRLVIDEERATRHGLRFQDLAMALRGANDGIVASSFRDPTLNDDMDIRVMLTEGDRRGLQDLLDVEVRTSGGYLLRLRDVGNVELSRGYLAYQRYDGKRTVSVYAEVDDNLATSLTTNQRLSARFAGIEEQYPQIEVTYGGEFAETGKAFDAIGDVFPVAFLAIYMILAALFRSYLQPLVVTLAIPFAFVGVVAGVGLLGYSISYLLFYSTVGLTGVVVNDSLVMVDFINRARARGMPVLQAVRESGIRRFRPILLTTMTTVVALLPMALGLQGSSKTYGPFAASIAFGLVVAMLGTLFVVPLAYTSLVVWQERLAAWWNPQTPRPAVNK